MVAEIQKVCFNLRSLIMVNYGILTNLQGYDSVNSLFEGVQQQLQSSLNLLYTIQNEINLS